MFPKHIPKADIQQMPLIRFEGRIHVIDNEGDLDQVIEQLRNELVLGFDTETKPTFVRGDYNHTALIQFSTLEEAFLIRINKLGLPDPLVRLMESKKLKKVGISLRDDLKDMKKIRPFKPGGFVDLNDIAKGLGITQIGVKSLTGIFLEQRISKGQQTTNWENATLTSAQQLYAATDAWICMKMYDHLHQKGVVNGSLG